MKRSRESSKEDDEEEEPNPLKRANAMLLPEFHFRNSEEVEDEEVEDEEVEVEEDEDEIKFVPDEIEQQIIRNALSMLDKTSSYDWTDPNWRRNEDDTGTMNLVSVAIIETEKAELYEIYIDLEYDRGYCDCYVSYCEYGTKDFKRLNFYWETYTDEDCFYIDKVVTETSYMFFSKEVNQRFMVDFTINNNWKLYPWCYFLPVNYHLKHL